MSSWFVAAMLSGIACALLAAAVTLAGWRRRLPEVAMLGTGLFSISVLATAFGTSGTSYGTDLAEWAAVLALPIGVLAVSPIFMPTSRIASNIARHWRLGVMAYSAGVVALGMLLLSIGGSVPTPMLMPLTAFGLAGAAMLVRRQLRLFNVSGRRAALVTAGAVATVALSSAASMTTSPGTSLAWALLGAENLGVLGAGVAIIVGYHNGREVSDVLAPLLSREPLAALDVGLSPEVHAFVAALEQKDSITRDHVVRTSALAMRTAIRSGLSPKQVREVALGALLHDIGKLVVPSDLINKPGKLTDEEFRTIKNHPAQGERLLLNAPSLAPAARYVRGHHERVDGSGYPDGLAGDEISFEVGIVSVADAWDAMTHTRQYREGMDTAKAESILRAGAETQWRLDAIECLLAEVHAGGEVELAALYRLGNVPTEGASEGDGFASCPCADALPVAVALPVADAGRSAASRPTALGREDLTRSIRAALGASQMVGQLVSVRIIGLSRIAELEGEAAAALMVEATEQLIAVATRIDDVVGCWEPNHFAISLAGASNDAAAEIARRIRVASQELAAMAPMLQRLRLKVTPLAIHLSEVDMLGALLDSPDLDDLDLSAT